LRRKQNRMIFRKFLISCILILLCTPFVFSQQIPDKPYFFRRSEIGGTSHHSLWEYGFNLAMDMHHLPKSKLIVRLCSTESLPVAITSAAINPLILSDFLSSESQSKPTISFNRINVDRSDRCLGKTKSNTATELWLVFNEENLPDSKEVVQACQIRIRDIKSSEDKKREILIGTYNHKLGINRLCESRVEKADKQRMLRFFCL
jgi:hypothetical protein